MWPAVSFITNILLDYLIMICMLSKIFAAKCGSSGIPFRLEVLPSGQLVLGCATPSCFGAENGGHGVIRDSQFNVGNMLTTKNYKITNYIH